MRAGASKAQSQRGLAEARSDTLSRAAKGRGRGVEEHRDQRDIAVSSTRTNERSSLPQFEITTVNPLQGWSSNRQCRTYVPLMSRTLKETDPINLPCLSRPFLTGSSALCQIMLRLPSNFTVYQSHDSTAYLSPWDALYSLPTPIKGYTHLSTLPICDPSGLHTTHAHP